MQSGQHLGVAARPEAEHVGENRPGREGQRQPEAARAARPTLPNEVDGEQRQHEQARVPGVERLVYETTVESKTEQRRHLDNQRCRKGQTQDDQRLGPRIRPRVIDVAGGDDQLPPQPFRVLARKLAG